MRSRIPAVLLAAAALLAEAGPVEAYVGPGAGFAVVGSFFVLLWALLLALLTLVTYPFRLVRQALRRRHLDPDAPRRVILLGFDGMDPGSTERWMREGKLPNLATLAAEGGFRKLGTTHPPLSPVAWSSFMTGVHPPRHGIFDFLGRDARTYLPFLSSASIEPAKRTLPIGKFQIPLGRPRMRLNRKAPPFWKILGERGVFSSIVRVPVTFPPERFHGTCLSGMSVPDLRGTQGSFTHLSEKVAGDTRTGGVEVPLERSGHRLTGTIPGPEHPFRPGESLSLPVTLEPCDEGVRVAVGREHFVLTPGQQSRWVSLEFRARPAVRVRGIARFRITRTEPPVGLYVTPIQIDPERPALPISHPAAYGSYLSKRFGPYATLGLAEDTWALNEGALDEEGFLEQAWSIQVEREQQLFDALDKTRSGIVVCVFDGPDRIQHMFHRYGDPDPRAPCPGDRARYAQAVEDIYRRMDDVVGRVRAQMDDDTVLLVLSDHGFASFRRGVNLNAWLRREGYLVLREGATGENDYLRDVDWSRTRAYAVGLAGLFLNVRGRERSGIVDPATEAPALKMELRQKLAELVDPENGRPAVRAVTDLGERYRGPYLDEAPDLVVGYGDGYRVSWEAAVGQVAGDVVVDNTRAWSGDHCVDPELVPGILFCNRPFSRSDPSIVDIAPTVLDLYGVPPPAHMEGVPVGIRRKGHPGPPVPDSGATAQNDGAGGC